MRTTFRAYSNVNKQTIFFSRERLKEVHMMDLEKFVGELLLMYKERRDSVNNQINIFNRGLDELTRKESLTAIEEAEKSDWRNRIKELCERRNRLSDAIDSMNDWCNGGAFCDGNPIVELMQDYFEKSQELNHEILVGKQASVRIMIRAELKDIENRLAFRGIIVFDGFKVIMNNEPAEDYGDEYP